MTNEDKKLAEEIDKIIEDNIIVNKANFQYCSEHEIINGFLLAGIREAMRKFAESYYQAKLESKLPSEEEIEEWAKKMINGTIHGDWEDANFLVGLKTGAKWLLNKLKDNG